MNTRNWNDTFWLTHDTLYSNGVPRNHPILLQTVRRFHVDALTHVSSKSHRCRGPVELTDNTSPKNQWFLVIEGETMQACLSMQPCENVRTGGCGILTLQIMDCYESTPLDLLHRQTYYCHRESLTAKAVLETLFFNGWHKYEMMPLESGFLCGRRYHMLAMLYDLQDTAWIGHRSLQDMEIFDFLEREYVPGQWTADNRRQLLSRAFPIRAGRFRPDVGMTGCAWVEG
ncbi:hypothetical protein CCM_07192 [Cordyceps militaris CM01]|uniref:DUF7770 domain-containing protein n=1 Tax=Cordyceps militaris (strain CM01) TaxID=983644 RepID=G3JM48_CORMM|nr:uncharacterized protein CCM_07192 [Cordyceps militaris CM01]EGX90772.1 hypothetical protein CCM_07192 [Cordyceps militaris CM01]